MNKYFEVGVAIGMDRLLDCWVENINMIDTYNVLSIWSWILFQWFRSLETNRIWCWNDWMHAAYILLGPESGFYSYDVQRRIKEHVVNCTSIHDYMAWQTYIHTYMHAYMHTCILACIHSYMHHQYIHTDIHTLDTYTHTTIPHIHTHTHSHIHTYIHWIYIEGSQFLMNVHAYSVLLNLILHPHDICIYIMPHPQVSHFWSVLRFCHSVS